MRPEVRSLQEAMAGEGYVADAAIATALFLAGELGKPLLIEGDAGVGKTEIAKVLARLLGTELIRLQCYEGLDVSTALYEWNYPRQMLRVRMSEHEGLDAERHRAGDLRPQLPAGAAAPARHHPPGRPGGAAHRRGGPRRRGLRGLPARGALRLPGDHPGAGHHPRRARARTSSSPPTAPARSGTRCAAAACTCTSTIRPWRRRSASSAPASRARARRLALEIGRFVQALRARRLARSPGVAESIDWARALVRLHQDRLDEEVVRATLGCLVKDRHDLRDAGAGRARAADRRGAATERRRPMSARPGRPPGPLRRQPSRAPASGSRRATRWTRCAPWSRADVADPEEVRLALRCTLKIRPRDAEAFEDLFAAPLAPGRGARRDLAPPRAAHGPGTPAGRARCPRPSGRHRGGGRGVRAGDQPG